MQILLRGKEGEANVWARQRQRQRHGPPPTPKNHRGRRAADLTRRERQGKVPKIIPPTTVSHNGPRRFREAAAAAKTGPACGRPGPRTPEPKISPVSCVWCSRPRHYRRWGSASSRVARTMTGYVGGGGGGGGFVSHRIRGQLRPLLIRWVVGQDMLAAGFPGRRPFPRPTSRTTRKKQ